MNGRRLDKVTFSVTKAVKKGRKQIVVWPVDALHDALKGNRQKEALKNEVRQILAVVTGKEWNADIIQSEYTLT